MDRNTKISLDNNTFLLERHPLYYLINQETGLEIVYNNDSIYWIKKLSTTPQTFSDFIDSIKKDFPDIPINIIEDDAQEFLNAMNKDGLLLFDSNAFTTKENDSIKIIEKPSLSELTLELTNFCNERCIHCYLGDSKFKKISHFPIEKIENLLIQFQELGGEYITFTGGEILLYPNLKEVLWLANSYGLKISLFSNLILLNNENIEFFKTLNIIDIQTSLYSSDPTCHDNITKVNGSYVKTINSIRKLQESKIPVRVVCPVMKKNKGTVVPLIKFCKNNNIEIKIDLNIQAQYDGDKVNLAQRLTIEEYKEVLEEIKSFDNEFCNNYLKRHCFTSNLKPLEFLNYPICSAGLTNPYICSNGNMALCPTLQGYVVGNIHEKSLKNIWWNNKNIQKIRNATQTSFPKCLNCKSIDYCGRCFAINYTEEKDFFTIPSYKCELAHISRKFIENN